MVTRNTLRLGCMIAFGLGCSREPNESPATPTLPSAAAPVAATASAPLPLASATMGQAPAAEASLHLHSIPLRHARPLADSPPASGLDLLAGSAPDAQHQSGTAYVAQLADDSSVHVTEWDLATAKALHDTTLDVPAWGLRFLPGTNQPIRILASAYNGPLVFVELTPSLQVVARRGIGRVSVLGPNAFAGDASFTVVVADGTADVTWAPSADSGLFAMSLTASGDLQARRLLERNQEQGSTASPMMHDNVAVLGGNAYVALVDAAYGLRVLRLTPDLRVDQDKTLPLPRSYDNPQAKLHAVDGHLVLDLPDQPDLLDLPLDLDLSHAAHRPRPAPPPPFPGGGEVCGPSLRLASELLALCNCGKQTCLSWAPAPP